MEIRHTQPSRYFRATGGGAGLNDDHRCGHGQPSISLHLLSQHDGVSEDIGILLPVCVAPTLVGAALAYIHEALGSEMADEFVTALLAARDKAIPQIAAAAAAYRAADEACCEAGYRTQGREHTCGSTTPPTTA